MKRAKIVHRFYYNGVMWITTCGHAVTGNTTITDLPVFVTCKKCLKSAEASKKLFK